MTFPLAAPRKAHASKAIVLRQIAIAREAGLQIAGWDALPDGTVRVRTAAGAAKDGSAFDHWEAKL